MRSSRGAGTTRRPGVFEAVKQRLSYGNEVQSLLAQYLERLITPGRPPLRILDVGCGTTSMLAMFSRSAGRTSSHLIGLDAHGPTIEWCRLHGFHDAYVLADARDEAAIPDVDVIVATDLVEHFEKPAALELVRLFEHKASKGVILFTPNGYIYNPFTPDNPYMEHKCGFTVSEFQALGYTCVGTGGPRRMRGAHSLPRGPKFLSLPALLVLSRVMRHMPRGSFHILARKSTAPTGQPSARSR